MPIGSGLGSSSASTVAGLFAAKTLLGDQTDSAKLLPFAMKGEEMACGHGHADNVAPALLGGFVLIRSYEPLDVVRLPIQRNCIARSFSLTWMYLRVRPGKLSGTRSR